MTRHVPGPAFCTSRVTLIFLALVLPGFANAADSLILSNVSLIAPESQDQTKKVNLHVVDGTLDIVSEGEITAEPDDAVYDAEDGFVIGQLQLGQPANFMLLDADPRKNIRALLDTRTYATFAVVEGTVIRNRLEAAQVAEREPAKPIQWIAYSPPPFAVPLDILDGRHRNHFEGRWGSAVFIAGMGIERTSWVGQDGNSRRQVGNLNGFEGGAVRGLRYGAVGTLKLFEKPWVWTLFAQTNAFDKGIDVDDIDDFTILDARIDIPLTERFTLSIGKQKPPISMERLMSIGTWPRQERAAHLDAFLPARRIGALIHGMLWDDRVTVAAGVFNSWIDKGQRGGPNDNPTSFGGRITWVPFESRDEATLLHLGGAYRQSNLRTGASVSATPEVLQAPDFVETPFLDGDRLTQGQAEVSFRTGALWLHSEYLQSNVEGTVFGDLTFEGYHGMISYALSGEMRPYLREAGLFRRLPVARSVNQNGWGAWEISTRFSHLDLSDQGLDGGEMDIWSSGLNWWLTPLASVGITYNYIELDRFGVKGESQVITTRLVLLLE